MIFGTSGCDVCDARKVVHVAAEHNRTVHMLCFTSKILVWGIMHLLIASRTFLSETRKFVDMNDWKRKHLFISLLYPI